MAPRPVQQAVPPDDLVDLTQEWSKTHAAYPGWLWTPRDNRIRIRSKTDRWADVVPDRAEELDVSDRLRLLSEYAWRLGRIYEPLRPQLAAAIRDALAEDETPGQERDREHLVLYLLRELRAEPPEVFDEANDQAAALHSAVARATRAYILAIRALSLLDEPAAAQALDQWPPDAGLEWDVRRAGVLLELGRRDDAVTLATEVRERAREPRREPVAQPFLAPSIEGAAQYILDRAHDGEDRWREIEPRDRDDELASIRCDPVTEMRTFSKRLEIDPPGLGSSETVTLDAFGREQMSYSFGQRLDYDRYREAFEYLGVHYDAGLPLWFGLRYTATGRAALWLADLSPEVAIDTLVRSLDHKALADYLDRPRVAQLPEGDVEARTDAAIQALTRALPHVHRLGPGGAFAPHERVVHVARVAATLLTRLAFRLGPERRMEVARLSLAPFGEPDTPLHTNEMRQFETLLNEALQLLTTEQTREIMPVVAGLPLRGGYTLTDPFRALALGGIESVPDEVVSAVPTWLRTAEDGEPDERSGALLRLQSLYAYGFLPEDAVSEFGRVLWSRRQDDGLPEHTNLRRWTLLSLPEPEPGLAQTAVRGALLRQLVQSATSKAQGFGSEFMSDLARSAPPTHPSETPSFEVRWVEWSADERDVVLSGLATFWETNRSQLTDRGGIGLGRDEARRVLTHVPDVLRRVVLPGVEPPDGVNPPTTFRAILRLREDLQAAGIPTRALLPALLAADRDRLDVSIGAVELEIRKGLASTDEDLARDAAEAVYLWAVMADDGRVPPLLDSLLDELGDVVLTRRPRILSPVLYWVNRLVRYVPNAVPDSLAARLCNALSLLLSETDLPSTEERLAARTDSDRLQILRRPDIRAAAAELALRLRASVDVADDCDATLQEWEAVVETDPFPVVRQVPDMLRDENGGPPSPS